MDQQLPPPTLVKTWINVIHSQNMPRDIIIERKRLLHYYFGSLELANTYAGHNQSTQKVVS
jgi:hypothetical protein